MGKAVGYLVKKWLNLRSRLLWNWRAVKEIKLVTVLITRGGETEMGRGANDLCQFQKDCQKKQNHNMKVSKQRRYFGGWSEGRADKGQASAQYWSALLPLASPISPPCPPPLPPLYNGDCFHHGMPHYGHSSSGERRLQVQNWEIFELRTRRQEELMQEVVS